MKKVQLIFMILTLLAVIMFSAFFIKKYENKKQINNSIEDINTVVSEFNNESDRDKKLSIFKNLNSEYEIYQNSKNANDEVLNKYKIEIEEMRNYFISAYNKISSENEIIDLNNCDDKEMINTCKNNLNDLIELVNSEIDIIYSEEEAKIFISGIEDIINDYDSRLTAINEKEKEEKKKEEEKAEGTTEDYSNEIAKEEKTDSEETVPDAVATPDSTTETPATETPPTQTPATEAPVNSGHTYASPSTPSSNILIDIQEGRVAWQSYTSDNGITMYCDQYGWIYYGDGSWTGYNQSDM